MDHTNKNENFLCWPGRNVNSLKDKTETSYKENLSQNIGVYARNPELTHKV